MWTLPQFWNRAQGKWSVKSELILHSWQCNSARDSFFWKLEMMNGYESLKIFRILRKLYPFPIRIFYQKYNIKNMISLGFRSCIAFRLNNFLTLLSYDLWFSKNIFNSKNFKKLMCWEKTEARFGFSTENYSGNDIYHSMKT